MEVAIFLEINPFVKIMTLFNTIEKMIPRRFRYPIKVFVLRLFVRINFLNQRKLFQSKLTRLIKYADAEKVFDDFCTVNSPYWEKLDRLESSPVILVEGFLAEYGPNYLMRTGIITKALEKVSDARPVILLVHGTKEEPYKRKLYESFKVFECVGIYDDIYARLTVLKKILIGILTRFYFHYSEFLFLFGRGESFIKLSFRGIQIGDMLYDEMIKECQKGKYTVRYIVRDHYYLFKKTFVYFFALDELCRKFNIKYYVSTHSQYITYGLLLRYFYHKDIVCIETTDDQVFIHNELFVPRYHMAMHKMIADQLPAILQNEDLLQQAKSELESRFAGKIEQIDAQLAYGGKQIYTKQDLKLKINIQNDNPIVFIFAHIFSDTPRGSSENLLFMDFYQWLLETLRHVRTIKNVNWIVKPHPSVKPYNEEGKVEEVVHKFKGKNSSIYVCPSDFSTAGLIGSADAITTCQGTVGLEYSCVGIPTVLAGSPFYSGFGFTSEPKSKKEYFDVLGDVGCLKPLSLDQIKTALAVYMGFKNVFSTDYTFIDTVLKSRVWGHDEEPDALGAYALMMDRLKKNDPKKSLLYDTIINSFSKKEN